LRVLIVDTQHLSILNTQYENMDIRQTKILIAATTLLLITVALAVTTSGLLSSQQTVPAKGTVTHTTGIGLYTDQTATIPCTNIDWGPLTAGRSATRTIYVKNTGNITESLHMTASDWIPTAVGSMLSLTWNKEDFSLPAGSVVATTLTLTVAQDSGEVDSFDFNITIEGTV
jgi:hypothetical protein